MKRLISKYVLFLYEQGIIKEEDKKLYQFGFWGGFLLFVNILVSFLILSVSGSFLPLFIFLVLFMILRTYTGGYHSDSAFLCFVLSQGSLIASLYFIKIVIHYFISSHFLPLLLVTISLSLIVIFLSPQEAPGNPLSENEKKHYKKIVVILFVIIFAATMICAICGILWIVAVWFVLDFILLLSFMAGQLKKRMGKQLW